MISENPLLRFSLFLGLLVFMFLLETLKPARSWIDLRKDRIIFGLKLALTNNLFMRLFITAPFLLWTNFINSKGLGLAPYLGLKGPAEILVTLVLFDFFDAIKHLAFHRLPFMWRFHRVHHTDRHLDILTALRYHPGEMVISAIWKALWLLLWGPSMLAFTVFEIVLNISSQFHHSNISLGPAENFFNKFIVTPKYHALHHTIHRERGDQNFSTIFSFWDHFLGSFANPKTEKVDLERLGTLQNEHLNFKKVLLSPLVDPNADGGYKGEAISSSKGQQEHLLKKVHEEMKKQKSILIDVRERPELVQKRPITGALLRPYSSYCQNRDSLYEELRKDFPRQNIYLYCAAGVRSGKMANDLANRGIRAINLGGVGDLELFPGH